VAQHLIGTPGNDTLVAPASGDSFWIEGLGGDDFLKGNGGADTLDGGSGADTMEGGGGNDTYIVDNAGDVITETAETGGSYDFVKTSVSYVLSAKIENLTYTGTGNFSGTGNEIANVITGGNGNDTLVGNGGGDHLIGGGGSDTMLGGIGDDRYDVDDAGDVVIEGAGEGRDTVFATLSSYTLGDDIEDLYAYFGSGDFLGIGNDAANYIVGGSGDDTLIGGAGDDSLWGYVGGTDTLIGGTGDDAYYIVDAASTVIEEAREGTDSVSTTLSNYTLGANLENLGLGGEVDATGIGNDLDNIIIFDAHVQQRHASLFGGGGDDTLIGGAGGDNLYGGAGNDTYVMNNGFNFYFGFDYVFENAGEGTDTVKTIASDFTLAENVENLIYLGTQKFFGYGNAQNNILIGGILADRLDGGAGADTMQGGTGNDAYLVDNAGDVVIENTGEGIDTVLVSLAAYTLGANVENATYTGGGSFTGTGNDLANVIIGGAGNDLLTGGEGNDSLTGNGGADVLQGGVGDDKYSVDNVGDVVSENAGEGIDTISTGLSSYALGANVENLKFTGSGNFIGTGNSLANIITGGAGNDTLDGSTGADTMSGGLGNDTYLVDDLGDVVRYETATGGRDLIKTTLLSYAIGSATVEDLTFVGTGNFSGDGNTLANTLVGGAGDDVLNGRAGADTMQGLLGADTYVVDNAGDVVIEIGDDIDTVRTALLSYTLGDRVEDLSFTGAGSHTGSGNALANVLFGAGSSDTLNGLDGNDTLDGKAGNDTLIGGAGNDTLNDPSGTNTMIGGTGDDTYVAYDMVDTITENAGEGTDTVNSVSLRYTLGGNLENLTFIGSGNFVGTGNAAANVITGGAGNDTITGGAGADRLSGGAGADLFVYATVADSGAAGRDTVTDFSSLEGDRVDFHLIDANTGVAGNQAFTFIGQAAFSGTAGELRYAQVSTNAGIAGDVNGDGLTDFSLSLTGTHALTAGDFVL